MDLIGIVGCGGLGRDVMPIARAISQRMRPGASAEAVFVVEYGPIGEQVNGHRVVSTDEFEALARSGRCMFNVAISDSAARQRLAEQMLDAGALPLMLQGEPAVVLDGAEIGPGSVLCAYTYVGANARIGRFFHGNIYSQVEHDCRIGDFVTFGPGVRCNGNIVIEDHAYIGSGAMIRQGSADRPVTIGRGAVVGMGAVVLDSVPAGCTVAGNPARPIRRG